MLVGLALDAEALMFVLHREIVGWALAPWLAAHIGFGVLAGLLYFRALRRATDIFAGGGGAGGALLLGGARFAALGLVLFIAAREGAWPLLCMAAGVMLARYATLRMKPATAA